MKWQSFWSVEFEVEMFYANFFVISVFEVIIFNEINCKSFLKYMLI